RRRRLDDHPLRVVDPESRAGPPRPVDASRNDAEADPRGCRRSDELAKLGRHHVRLAYARVERGLFEYHSERAVAAGEHALAGHTDGYARLTVTRNAGDLADPAQARGRVALGLEQARDDAGLVDPELSGALEQHRKLVLQPPQAGALQPPPL